MDQELSLRKRRVKKKSKKKSVKLTRRFSIPISIKLGVSLFLLTVIFLLLHSWIYQLNIEIKQLQDQLNTVQAEIDDKDGRLHSSTNLKEIEAQARSYGMKEATNDQYIYESAAKKQTVLPNTSVGLIDYLNFFTQYRDRFLWGLNE